MRTLCFSLVIFLLAIPGTFADDLDRYVEQRLKRNNVPGASIAVLRDGRIINARGYGLADVELEVPATERTVYQWASVTKQFTAAAAMLLIQDGKLKLDDRLSRFYTNSPAAWSNVSVAHLIYHTSGIKSYTGLKDFFKTLRKDYTPDELIGLVTNEPMDFQPGQKWSYNNSGYFLLGLVIEQVSAKSYGDFLKERIFDPLGMDTARVNHQFDIIPNRATGYGARSNKILRAEFVSPSQPYAAGALMGTVLDLAKWDAALYTDKLFSASVRDELWKPVKLNDGKTHPYGFGWTLGELRGHRYVAHGGGIHGFSTYITRFLDDKLTVIVLMNGGGDSGSIAHGIAGHFLPGLTLSSIKPPRRDPDPELTKHLRQSLFDLADNCNSDLITREFRQNYSTNRAATLKTRLSNMKSFSFVTSDPPPKDRQDRFGVPIARVCACKLVTPDETRFYTFELTRDNKVAWYQSSAE
ncbi:MAG: beta-lactamase family protein [Verrucomicrobia subdivision 3 bacterium]|nr:beta-lactamase family protein [Limisphaerales bacterium]